MKYCMKYFIPPPRIMSKIKKAVFVAVVRFNLFGWVTYPLTTQNALKTAKNGPGGFPKFTTSSITQHFAALSLHFLGVRSCFVGSWRVLFVMLHLFFAKVRKNQKRCNRFTTPTPPKMKNYIFYDAAYFSISRFTCIGLNCFPWRVL